MKPYYQSDNVTIFCADALDAVREMPSESVHLCLTSPPYWNLRDYGTAKWEGGSEECDHRAPDDSGKTGNKGNSKEHAGRFATDTCRKCGAVRVDKQIGLENQFDCGGHGLVRLKSDLSKDQLEYVAQQLSALGCHNGGTHGNDGKE